MGHRRLRADLRQREHRTCSATSRANILRTPISGARVHPDDLAAVEAEAVHLFRKGRHSVEYRFRKKDGSWCWVGDEQRLVRDAAGEPEEVVGSWSDITERKAAERRRRGARERIERLLASSPAVIYSFKARTTTRQPSSAGTSRNCSATSARTISRAPTSGTAAIHPDDQERVLGEFERLLEEGHLSNEYRFRRKDGTWCWIGDELHLLRDAAGEPVEVVGAWSDITARKQLGEVLVAAQDRLVHLLSSAPRGDLQLSRHRRFRAHLRQRQHPGNPGLRAARVSREPGLLVALGPSRRPAAVEAQSAHLFQRGHHTGEYRFRKADGRYCWVNDEQRLVRDRNGEPEEVVGSWSDITERKAGRGGGRGGPAAHRAPARELAGGDL